MWICTQFVGTLLLATRLVSGQSSKFPECVQTCITDNPTSSFCDGDETGADLDNCTCQSLSGSLLVQCIQTCPQSDQAAYAAVVPESCRGQLFPGVTVTSTPSSTRGQSQSTSSENTATTQTSATITGQPGSTATPDIAPGHHVPGFVAAGGILAAFIL